MDTWARGTMGHHLGFLGLLLSVLLQSVFATHGISLFKSRSVPLVQEPGIRSSIITHLFIQQLFLFTYYGTHIILGIWLYSIDQEKVEQENKIQG